MNDPQDKTRTEPGEDRWPWSPDETRNEQIARLRRTAEEYLRKGWKRDAAINTRFADYYQGLLDAE